MLVMRWNLFLCVIIHMIDFLCSPKSKEASISRYSSKYRQGRKTNWYLGYTALWCGIFKQSPISFCPVFRGVEVVATTAKTYQAR